MNEGIIALILSVALTTGVDTNLFRAIIETENAALDPYAINVNDNGTLDRGLCQLNSSWFKDPLWYEPEVNLKAGAKYLKECLAEARGNKWVAAIMYNAGYQWYRAGRLPPEPSIEYAVKVFKKYNVLRGYHF